MSIKDDEYEIESLYQAGDAALMAADLDVLARILSDDYIQYDDRGRPADKSQILDNLRSGAVRYPAIIPTGKTIRLFGDMAVVHGSESDEVEEAGVRRHVRYMYLDVLMRRNGEWKLVASQLARPVER